MSMRSAIGTAFDELSAESTSTDQRSQVADVTVDKVAGSGEGDVSTDAIKTTELTSKTNDVEIPIEGKQHVAEPLVDATHPKAIRERVLREHPELADHLNSILDPTLKEMERGMNKRFEEAAADKKVAAERLVLAERLKNVSQDDLVGMASCLHALQYGTPQQKQEAADLLFEIQQEARTSLNTANNYNPQTANQQDTPELQEMRVFIQQQRVQQVNAQVESVYDSLKSDFGGNPIPQIHKEHVAEELQKLGITTLDAALNAIPIVWKAHYGADYKTAEALKRGQALRQEKQSLGISGGMAPVSAGSGSTPKPKGMRNALSALMDEQGVR